MVTYSQPEYICRNRMSLTSMLYHTTNLMKPAIRCASSHWKFWKLWKFWKFSTHLMMWQLIENFENFHNFQNFQWEDAHLEWVNFQVAVKIFFFVEFSNLLYCNAIKVLFPPHKLCLIQFSCAKNFRVAMLLQSKVEKLGQLYILV